ncbi:MAG: polyprenyl synthetase family protein [Agromyces sp.]
MYPLSSSDLAEHLADVEEVLEGFFTVAVERAGSRSSAYQQLWEQLRHSARGGKRLRPRLLVCSYVCLGGTDVHRAAFAAAAFELLHTALIVHDDVIDRDFVRRGMPNVSGSYRDKAHTAGLALPLAEHRGMGAAVIAGDLALAGAYQLMRHATVDSERAEPLFALLDDAVYESAAGELVDLDFSLQHTTIANVEDIVDMERLKTAVYSFEAPLRAGAILAGASAETVRALGLFGNHIGIAYQVVDDLLGVFGNETLTGKPVISDLREGKQTVVIGFAATTPQWAEISERFGDPDLSVEAADHIRALLIESGAKAQAEALAARNADDARAVLNGPHIPARLRDSLIPLIDDAVERMR